MSVNSPLDYIIVGQGIAGSVLAKQLLDNGANVRIIDDHHNSSSSIVAGGVMHPMSFRRLALSWKADLLIPYAIDFYRRQEKEWKQQFFYAKKMIRVLSSVEEQNNWMGRIADPPFDQLLYDFQEDLSSYPFQSEFGLGGVNLAGRLDVKTFLEKARSSFQEDSLIIEETFDHSQLKIEDKHIMYRDLKADNIIFCEGYKYIFNPYFDYLPQNLTKGEILLLESEDFPDVLLSKGCFILPIEKNKFILGATYKWKTYDNQPTEEGKNELIEKLNQVGNFKYRIIEHRAGVRPTIPDRRPIIGRHPKHKNVILFNGLGSKGVMIAPYFSNELVKHLIYNQELDKEVSIDRFTKKHLHKCVV